MKNGITQKDLDRAYQKGLTEGFNNASPEITKTAFAAVALAAKEEFGFGWQRVKRLLTATNNNIINHLDSVEALDKVFEEIGLVLDFHDPLEPVKEVTKDD